MYQRHPGQAPSPTSASLLLANNNPAVAKSPQTALAPMTSSPQKMFSPPNSPPSAMNVSVTSTPFTSPPMMGNPFTSPPQTAPAKISGAVSPTGPAMHGTGTFCEPKALFSPPPTQNAGTSMGTFADPPSSPRNASPMRMASSSDFSMMSNGGNGVMMMSPPGNMAPHGTPPTNGVMMATPNGMVPMSPTHNGGGVPLMPQSNATNQNTGVQIIQQGPNGTTLVPVSPTQRTATSPSPGPGPAVFSPPPAAMQQPHPQPQPMAAQTTDNHELSMAKDAATRPKKEMDTVSTTKTSSDGTVSLTTSDGAEIALPPLPEVSNIMEEYGVQINFLDNKKREYSAIRESRDREFVDTTIKLGEQLREQEYVKQRLEAKNKEMGIALSYAERNLAEAERVQRDLEMERAEERVAEEAFDKHLAEELCKLETQELQLRQHEMKSLRDRAVEVTKMKQALRDEQLTLNITRRVIQKTTAEKETELAKKEEELQLLQQMNHLHMKETQKRREVVDTYCCLDTLNTHLAGEFAAQTQAVLREARNPADRGSGRGGGARERSSSAFERSFSPHSRTRSPRSQSQSRSSSPYAASSKAGRYASPAQRRQAPSPLRSTSHGGESVRDYHETRGGGRGDWMGVPGDSLDSRQARYPSRGKERDYRSLKSPPSPRSRSPAWTGKGRDLSPSPSSGFASPAPHSSRWMFSTASHMQALSEASPRGSPSPRMRRSPSPGSPFARTPSPPLSNSLTPPRHLYARSLTASMASPRSPSNWREANMGNASNRGLSPQRGGASSSYQHNNNFSSHFSQQRSASKHGQQHSSSSGLLPPPASEREPFSLSQFDEEAHQPPPREYSPTDTNESSTRLQEAEERTRALEQRVRKLEAENEHLRTSLQKSIEPLSTPHSNNSSNQTNTNTPQASHQPHQRGHDNLETPRWERDHPTVTSNPQRDGQTTRDRSTLDLEGDPSTRTHMLDWSTLDKTSMATPRGKDGWGEGGGLVIRPEGGGGKFNHLLDHPSSTMTTFKGNKAINRTSSAIVTTNKLQMRDDPPVGVAMSLHEELFCSVHKDGGKSQQHIKMLSTMTPLREGRRGSRDGGAPSRARSRSCDSGVRSGEIGGVVGTTRTIASSVAVVPSSAASSSGSSTTSSSSSSCSDVPPSKHRRPLLTRSNSSMTGQGSLGSPLADVRKRISVWRQTTGSMVEGKST